MASDRPGTEHPRRERGRPAGGSTPRPPAAAGGAVNGAPGGASEPAPAAGPATAPGPSGAGRVGGSPGGTRVAELVALAGEIEGCRACPRLVSWREEVAVTKRASFADQRYWGRPVPGFGDPAASLLVVGLAPAAHGANRTGRVFTGDRSGDWLFRALHRAGYANQPTSTARDDGLALRGAWVSAAVRCVPPANKPTPAERATCAPFLAREWALLTGVQVVVALGAFAHRAVCDLAGAADGPRLRPRPRFGHLAEHVLPGGRVLLGSYHPSQQNTFTGVLTEPAFDAVFSRARALTTP